jgi:hypothetical protein
MSKTAEILNAKADLVLGKVPTEQIPIIDVLPVGAILLILAEQATVNILSTGTWAEDPIISDLMNKGQVKKLIQAWKRIR